MLYSRLWNGFELPFGCSKIWHMRYCRRISPRLLLSKKKIMKRILLLIAATGCLFSACTKKSSDSTTVTPSTTIPTNGWKLGTTSYSSAFVGRTGSATLSAFDAIPSGSSPAANTCNVFFSAFPTAGGTYTIVQYPAATALTSTQIGVTAGLFATSKTYYSTGIDAITATVTVTGGKIKVEIPSVWVKNTTGGDSLKLTGTVLEQ